MTDRHRSYIAIALVVGACTLILAFLLPGSATVSPRTAGQHAVSLSLGSQRSTTTTGPTPTTAHATSTTAGTGSAAPGVRSTTGEAPASKGRGSQGGNAVSQLGGATTLGGGAGPTTTVVPPPLPTTTSTTSTTSTPPTTPQSPQPPSPNDCDGQPDIGAASGVQWTCTFDSDFTGTSLNSNQWTVQQTASSGFTDGPDCYVDNPDNVSVGGGVLTLTVRQVAPFTCQKPLGSFTSDYTSGEVTTYFKWSQEYGLFEVRAKLPDSTVPGLLDTLWLYPSEERLYGGNGASGEIDFAEWWSQYPTWDIPVVHYNNKTDPDSTTHCDVNPGQFNTYGVEWTPLNISILLNGSVCLTDDWDPLPPQTKPEPFNQPFTLNLTQALASTFSAGSTPLPASMEVQWVHVWSENGS